MRSRPSEVKRDEEAGSEGRARPFDPSYRKCVLMVGGEVESRCEKE